MVQKMNSVEEDFKQKFRGKRGLKLKNTHKCDAVLDFVPIVSRAGTDISAALDRLNTSEVHKPVVLVVLHPTFEHEKVVPDSNNAVNRENTFAVDCLFNEDVGLLKCPMNDEAYKKIATHLKSKKLTSYAYYKDLPSPFPSLDDNNDTRDTNSLIHPTEDSPWSKFLTPKYLVVSIMVSVLILVPVMLKVFNKI